MSLSIGIVGLPNVGKSTLFEALVNKEVDRANYPFATIDPNVGIVPVPDSRADELAKLENSARRIYATMEFHDIAGLIRGAHKGEGLGNAFLSHIREVDAIVYVLRAFKDSRIIHTEGTVDPIAEKEILETELALKDLETVTRRLEAVEGKMKAGETKETIKERNALQAAREVLEKGTSLVAHAFGDDEKALLSSFQLLTLKPRIYLLNGSAEEVSTEVADFFSSHGLTYLAISLIDEHGGKDLSPEERAAFGLSGLDRLICTCYELVGLITFFTTGPGGTRAWTTRDGSTAKEAAGVIHSDFSQYFIRAEIISYDDLIAAGGFAPARERGQVRTEGKEYRMQDGDGMVVRH